MKRRNVSSRLSYGNLFEGWEIAIAKALVGEFCNSKPFGPDDFDDLLQEVLSHWGRKCRRYRPERGASPRTYMRKVVRHKLLELARARTRYKRTTLDHAEALDDPPGKQTDARTRQRSRATADTRTPEQIELKIDISLMRNKVTPRQRDILDLIDDGITEKTVIAKRLGIHRDTVHKEFLRIRELFENASLKKYLK